MRHRSPKAPSRGSSLCALVFIWGSTPAGLVAQATDRAPDHFAEAGISTGSYVAVSTRLEVTFLRFDVLTLEVRIPTGRAARLERIAAVERYSEEVADSLAAAVLDSPVLWARQELLRDVGSGRFTAGMLETVDQAVDVGWVSAEDRVSLANDLTSLFSFLEGRGALRGDEILFEVRGDSVRTIYRTSDGTVLLDRTTAAAGAREASVPSFFAPGTRFRRGLVESLLRRTTR